MNSFLYSHRQLDRSSNGTIADISHGKEPTDLPDLMLRSYDTGHNTVTAACTGPGQGLTSVRRSCAHLSLGDDIDFIDTANEDPGDRKSVPKPETNFRLRYQQKFQKSNITPDQNANKEVNSLAEIGMRPWKLSKSEVPKEETTKIHQLKTEAKGGKVNIIVSMISTTQVKADASIKRPSSDSYNKNIEIPKENISPNDNTNMGKPGTNDNKSFALNDLMTTSTILNCNTNTSPDEYAGISNWKRENDDAYGISLSLYEKNYITQESTGNPIADCYGLVKRGNSVAMALADGVNWG